MKNAFYFIAGVMFITLISATTVSIMTVKPATPKSTVIFGTDSGISDVEYRCKALVKKGFIVKSISGTSKYGHTWIVVMEKY